MEIGVLVVSIAASIIAAVSAWIAWKQRQDAQTAAADARDDAQLSIETARRLADAQEKIAAGYEADRQRASMVQANKLRLTAIRRGSRDAQVRLNNVSDEPVFHVTIQSIELYVNGAETTASWHPNPNTSPVLNRSRFGGQLVGSGCY